MFTKIIIAILSIYFVSLVSISLFQRKLLYHPKINNHAETYKLNHQIDVISINSDHQLVGWHHKKEGNTKTILFLHGNAGTLNNRIYKLNEFSKLNLNYLIFAYRGYSNNEGKPDEKGIYKDANAAIKWLKLNGVEEKNIIIYGESLGTAVAVEVSQNKKFGGIILEAPFTSMIELGQRYYPFFPVRFLLKDKYETKLKLKNVIIPMLVMHGKRDKIVPFFMGEKVFQLANNPKTIYVNEYDDHMMEFNQELILSLEKFIKKIK